MSIEDHYKYLQRRIAKCGCLDSLYVVWAYSNFMQVKDFKFPESIEKPAEFVSSSPVAGIYEWELEIVAREAIIHAGDASKSLRDWATIAAVVTRIRRLENELYGEKEGRDIFVELTRISHRQFPWQGQRPGTALLNRYYRIFNDAEISRICERVTGLTTKQVYWCGVLLYYEFLSLAGLRLPISVNLKSIASDDVTSFLNFTCRTLAELREELAAEHRVDHTYAYQIGALFRYPIIMAEKGSKGMIICPLPSLLFWRLTSGLYFDLMKGDRDGFGRALGRSFQSYVGEVLERTQTNAGHVVLEEAKYGPKKRRADTCDWVLAGHNNAAAFIECKSKRMALAARTATGTAFDAELSKLAEGIAQLYRSLNDYRLGKYPQLSYAPERKQFPVIVTLEEWYLFGDPILSKIRGAVAEHLQRSGLSEEVIDDAPFSIMSINEFEAAAQIIDKVGLATFFEGKLQNAEMRTWTYENYMRESFKVEWKNRRAGLNWQDEGIFEQFIAEETD